MFNKKRCIENIYFLAREQGKRIGDIEKNAGVSIGYLSRLNKDDNNANPSIDVLDAIANELNVTLDALINYEFEELTATEKYVLDFLSKLIHDTQYKELVWDKESKKTLENSFDELCQYATHPLLQDRLITTSSTNYKVPAYNSLYFPYQDMYVFKDGFKLKMPQNTTLYLMCVKTVDQDNIPNDEWTEIYEMYLKQRGNMHKICYSGHKLNSLFAKILQKLYIVVTESCKHAKINPDIKNILDAFMQGTELVDEEISGFKNIDDDDLPFN